MHILLVILGSALPDIDYRVGIKHRTLTHSLVFLGVTLLLPPLGLGVGLHILLDLLTPTGTQLLWPHKQYYIILGSPLKTGKHDTLIILLILGGMML